ncbi:MAG: DUF642 domain-containing protein [Polymorphobacter sp.]
MRFFTYGVMAAAMALSASQAQAVTNLITNGSFETVGASTVFTNGVATILGANNTVLPGWTGLTGRAYMINRNYDASAGKNSIDLSHTTGGPDCCNGTISTTVSGFVVNRTYRLSFDLSGKPGGTVDPVLNLLIPGRISRDYTFSRPVDQTALNMGWQRVFHQFRALQTQYTVQFKNNNTTNELRFFGPVIDNVIMAEAIPEPHNWALFIIGFGLTGTILRRRVAQQAA